MNVHCLLHAPFEGPGLVAGWAAARGHKLALTRLYEGAALPEPGSVDFLVVMGGPMNVFEYRVYPWLRTEKSYLGRTIDRGQPVLGVCLGAQLIADVLGASVYQNPEKEIGWFPVQWRASREADRLLGDHDAESVAFHWHGDTFDLPPDSEWLAESAACRHQAFIFRRRVAGLQFHLEVTATEVEQMLLHCAQDLTVGRFIQTAAEIREASAPLEPARALLWNLLDRLTGWENRDAHVP
jgi:GMP synthase-like glutamine amidotransferase